MIELYRNKMKGNKMENIKNMAIGAAIIFIPLAAWCTGVADSIEDGNGWGWIMDTAFPPWGMIHGVLVWIGVT
jgi:hypothetical protein